MSQFYLKQFIDDLVAKRYRIFYDPNTNEVIIDDNIDTIVHQKLSVNYNKTKKVFELKYKEV